jgi:hypothetical protein
MIDNIKWSESMQKNKFIKKLNVMLLIVLFSTITVSSGVRSISTCNKMDFRNLDKCTIFDSGPGELIGDMAGSISSSLGAIDYDSDGDIDILEGADNFFNMLTNNEGVFERQTIYTLPPNQDGFGDSLDRVPFPVGDFNNDGQQDFIIGGVQGIIRLFINNNSQPGSPRFDNYTIAEFGQCVWGITVADFNGNGWLDFAASHATSPLEYSTITLFYNNGDLTFTQKDVYHLDMNYINDLAAGDFTGDGNVDLLYTRNIYTWHGRLPLNVMSQYVLLENEGDETFGSERVIAERGRDLSFWFGLVFFNIIQNRIRNSLGFNRINPQLATADFNNNGHIDFVAGDNSGMIELFLNDGQGNFKSNGVIHKYGHLSWGLTAVDFDNNGNIDILVSALPWYEGFFEGQIWLKRNQLDQAENK